MDLKKISAQVVTACAKAQKFILDNKNKVKNKDIELKSLNSLVSYVDKGAEDILVKGLKPILPEAGFIAEEETETERGDRYNWIIDPLDGTTNFLHGIPVYAISVALMDGKEVVLGVVWELGQDECFHAFKGGGAFMNNEPIQVSTNSDFSQSLLATGFPYYDFSRMQDFLKLLEDLFKSTRGVRRLGSAATDLAYVACGRFDGFFEYGLSPWDVAAGALIVQEAGGVVSDYKGGENYIFGAEIMAGSKSAGHQLLKKIRKHLD